MCKENINIEGKEKIMRVYPTIKKSVKKSTASKEQVIKIQNKKIVELVEQNALQSLDIEILKCFINTMQHQDDFNEFKKGYYHGMKRMGN